MANCERDGDGLGVPLCVDAAWISEQASEVVFHVQLSDE
jgi:hypothetical protein